MLIAAIALFGIGFPALRWLNAVLGAWVAVAALLLPHTSAVTVWNNIIVGLAVLLVSVGGLSRPMMQSPMP